MFHNANLYPPAHFRQALFATQGSAPEARHLYRKTFREMFKLRQERRGGRPLGLYRPDGARFRFGFGGYIYAAPTALRLPSRRAKKNRPEANLRPGENFSAAYLALHLGQCAQSVLPSAQQAIVQVGLLAEQASPPQDLWQDLQPVVSSAAAQTIYYV